MNTRKYIRLRQELIDGRPSLRLIVPDGEPAAVAESLSLGKVSLKLACPGLYPHTYNGNECHACQQGLPVEPLTVSHTADGDRPLISPKRWGQKLKQIINVLRQP